jgi:hypothetical protein
LQNTCYGLLTESSHRYTDAQIAAHGHTRAIAAVNTLLNDRLLGNSTPRAALLLPPSPPLALPPSLPSFTPTSPPGLECQTQPDQKLCRHAAPAEAVPLAPCGESHLQLAVLPTDVRARLQAAPHRGAPRRRCAHHEVGGVCERGGGEAMLLPCCLRWYF